MHGRPYRIRIEKKQCLKLSKLVVCTGLKQGYSISPTLFNLVLEKAIMEIQMETTGIEIGQQCI